MSSPDQWYFVDGSATKGPLPAAHVVQMINAGLLSPGAHVAQAGWQNWKPASEVLPIGFAGPAPVTSKRDSQYGTTQQQPVAVVAASPRAVQDVYGRGPRDDRSPAAAAMAELSAISNRVSQIPAAAVLGGLKSTGITVAALVLAFTAGFIAKKMAETNELEKQQTPRAEQVVKNIETYQKAGMEIPSNLSLNVRQWARLDTDDFNKRQEALDAMWQQYGQAQQLVQQVENEKKLGLIIPPNLGPLTANQLARLSPEEFQRKQQAVNELVRQSRRRTR